MLHHHLLKRLRLVFSLIVALSLLIAPIVLAAPGDLDPTFDSDGYFIPFTAGAQQFHDVVQQPDGKLVAAGYVDGAGRDFAIVRYSAAGVPDAGFGTGGQVTTSFGPGDDLAYALALQSDGKIVAAGVATYGATTVFAVARYLSTTGALDPSFGVGGLVTTTFTGADTAYDVAIQTDGKIVVAGDAGAIFAAARYTTAGALDTTFDTDGRVTTTVGANDIAHEVLIQSDGKIILAGQTDSGGSDDFALVRYNTNGSIDGVFGSGGIVRTDFNAGTNDIGLAAALQSDGKIVVAGTINTNVSDFALARYTTTGALDTTFSGDGKVTTDFNADGDSPFAVGVQSTGKIVVVGWSNNGTANYDFALARYTTAGALDATFGGGDGLVLTNFPTNGEDLAYGMTIQADRKIVVVGSSDNGTASGVDFAIARYESPNALPTVTNVSKADLEDQTIAFTAADFTAHFSDADGDALAAIKITSLPANGTLQLNGVDVTLNQEIAAGSLGNLDFVPTPDWYGSTSFGWNGTDSIDYAATGALVNITVTSVNDAPNFVAGSDQTVLEDAAAQTVTGWATSITPGPNEVGQTLTFTVTNDNNALFSAQPAINPAGTLTFTPAPDAYGSAQVTVILHDDGGTANGGVDTSAPQTFTINVTPVNDAPSFVKGADQIVAEDSGLHTVPVWATSISRGPNEPTQTLTFSATTSNNALFASLPSINSTSGDLTYQGAPDAFGAAVVTVTLRDNGGTANGGVDVSAPQTFTITINPVNDAPVVASYSRSGLEDTAIAFSSADFTTRFSDVDADPMDRIKITSLPANGALKLSGVDVIVDQEITTAGLGNLAFVPAPDWNGVTSFGWNGFDGTVYAASNATVTLTLTAVNDAPSFTKGANQTVNEDAGAQTVTGWATAISAGPADEAAQTLAFSVTNDNAALFSAPPAVNALNGNLTYTPAANAFGTAVVTVTLSDNGGTANGGVDTSAPQTFTITVNPVNDAPSFTKGADQTVNEDAGAQTVTGWATNISAGPANESGQVLNFMVFNDNNALFSAQPAVSPIGTLTFTPAPDAHGVATVTVVLHDDGGIANGGVDTTVPQFFVITVNSVNDAPSFVKGADQTVNEDAGAQSIANWATAISPGPANEAGQTLIFSATNTNPGLFALQPAVDVSGTLTFTPLPDAFGSATVTVALKDDGGTANGGVDTSAPQTFVITVNAVNDAPSFAKGGDQVLNEDAGAQTVVGWATAISPGPANEASQTLTFTLASDNAALFSAGPAVSPIGTLTFTPAPNAFGTAHITATLHDSGGTANGGVDVSAPQTFTITVNSVNDAPSFLKGPDIHVITSTFQTFPGWATAISAGPANETGQTMIFSITTNNPALFEVPPALTPDGTLTFKTWDNYSGSALATVTLHDNGGTANGGVDTSAPQTFTIQAQIAGDVPVNIVPGPQETSLNTPLIFSAANGNRLAIYDIDAIQFNELFSVTLTISNGVVTINGATGLTLTTGISGTLVQFTGLITDVNNALEGLRFDPDLDFYGLTTLVITTQDLGHPGEPESYVVSDPIDIRVIAPPLAADDAYNGLENQTLVVNAANGVLSNDTPRSARPLTATLVSDVSTGLLVLNADGSFVYVPPQFFNGSVSFTYRANDHGLLSDIATVTLTLAAVNQAPSFNTGPTPVVNEDVGAQTLLGWATGLSVGPADEGGQVMTFTLETNQPGLFSVLPDLDETTGNLTFTPAPDQFGAATITATLQDNGGTANGGSDTTIKTFSIVVNAVNDAPSFLKGADVEVMAGSITHTLAGWATGMSAGPANETGQSLMFVISTTHDALFSVQPAIDAVTGDLTFTPAAGQYGTATVTVRLMDDGGTANGGVNTSAPQTFVITVKPYRLFLPIVRR